MLHFTATRQLVASQLAAHALPKDVKTRGDLIREEVNFVPFQISLSESQSLSWGRISSYFAWPLLFEFVFVFVFVVVAVAAATR